MQRKCRSSVRLWPSAAPEGPSVAVVAEGAPGVVIPGYRDGNTSGQSGHYRRRIKPVEARAAPVVLGQAANIRGDVAVRSRHYSGSEFEAVISWWNRQVSACVEGKGILRRASSNVRQRSVQRRPPALGIEPTMARRRQYDRWLNCV